MLADKIKAAGFDSKADFAKFFRLNNSTITRWGNNPPIWVHYVLDVRIELKRIVGEL